MLDDQTLVSVVLITEDAADDDVFNTFKNITEQTHRKIDIIISTFREDIDELKDCLLYTSPSPRDRTRSRMPSSA